MGTKDLQKYMDLNYPIEIRHIPDEEGGGVAATIPFLGADAFVGDGENISEALKSLNRVKEKLFKYYLENNIKIPLPPKTEDYSGKFVVRVPKYLHQELAEKAKENGVSLNTFCVSLLSQNIVGSVIGESLIFIAKNLQSLSSRLGNYIFAKRLEEYSRPAIYFPEEREYGKTA